MLTHTILLLSLLLSYVSSELIAVVEINRHGARTPSNFPKLTAKKYFGARDKSLTINGYRQQQLLGEWVRTKYLTNNHLLSPKYDQNEFEMISSPSQRTLFSSEGFLSGLYPEYTVKMNYDDQSGLKNDDLPPLDGSVIEFKEIPVEVLNYTGDSLFHATKCQFKGKKLQTWLEEEHNKDMFEINKSEIESTLKELRTLLNIPDSFTTNNSDKDLKEVVSYLLPFIYHYPDCKTKITDDTWKAVKKFVINKWYTIRHTNTKYLRIAASKFLDDIKEMFSNVIQNKSKLKYRVFSGHDTVIVNVLSNLLKPEYVVDTANKAISDDSAFNQIVPPFACNLFFELHKVEGKYQVKVIYDGRPLVEGFKFLDSKDFQDGMIDYSKFEGLFDKLIEEDYKLLDCQEGSNTVGGAGENQLRTKYFLKK